MKNAKGAMQTYPFGDYINFGTTRHFFRGENQRYPVSCPTLNRQISKLTLQDQEIYRAVSNLRINQFAKFIFQFNIVPYWMAKVSDVNFKAIAQHYGFSTHLLDLTNDVLTALFFATCYYDKVVRCYKPLTNEKSKQAQIHNIV